MRGAILSCLSVATGACTQSNNNLVTFDERRRFGMRARYSF